MLENVYKKKKHPTSIDYQLLALILGASWSANRIRYWFDHRRTSNQPSKYCRSTINNEDMDLWDKFCLESLSNERESMLTQSKARCAAYLAANYEFWNQRDYKIKGWPQLNTLCRLKLAYEQEATTNKDEEIHLSQTFKEEISTFVPVTEQLNFGSRDSSGKNLSV